MAVDKKYSEFVRSLALSGENRTFLNSDEDKTVTVLTNLFSVSRDEVRIFAGNLYENVGDRTDYIIALSEFIEHGGKLFILLNKYNREEAKDSDLFKRLSYLKSQGKPIDVKSTPSSPYIKRDEEKVPVHFTVGDKKSICIETDTEKRTAMCNFNFPQLAESTVEFFDKLFNHDAAVEIDIENLF